jgi:hypothetical protein
MTIEVAGRVIEGVPACAPVSAETDDAGNKKDRWAEIELYLLDNGAWLAHRTGMSVVYHRADTRCRTRAGGQSGEPACIDDLPDEAVPCVICQPRAPQFLAGTPGEIRFEFPRHTWDEAPTPQLLKLRLTTSRSRDGTVSVFTSDLVAELLRNAAKIHPEFAPLLAA